MSKLNFSFARLGTLVTLGALLSSLVACTEIVDDDTVASDDALTAGRSLKVISGTLITDMAAGGSFVPVLRPPVNTGVRLEKSIDEYHFADFDGDKRADIFRIEWAGSADRQIKNWQVLYNGSSRWVHTATSSTATLDQLKFGHFDDDNKLDVLAVMPSADGSPTNQWRVTYNFAPSWTTIGFGSSAASADLRTGDFDGDGKTDLFVILPGGKWSFSSGARTPWQSLHATSSAALSQLAFADFTGDGATDVFITLGGQWRLASTPNPITPATPETAWEVINASSATLSELRFGDFDGDGRADALAIIGGRLHVSLGARTVWIDTGIRTTHRLQDLALADWNGDGATDVLFLE